jgi:hypothetical protein
MPIPNGGHDVLLARPDDRRTRHERREQLRCGCATIPCIATTADHPAAKHLAKPNTDAFSKGRRGLGIERRANTKLVKS